MMFKIIEGEDKYIEKIYEDFKQDFLNPHVTRSEILKKFDISILKYNKLRLRVCKECNVKSKPISKRSTQIITDNTYIYPSGSRYKITKTMNSKTSSYGVYDDFEDAKKIRDKLLECNWDKTQLKRILNEVGVKSE